MLWNKYQDFGWKSQDQVGQIVLSSDQNYKAWAPGQPAPARAL